MKLYKKHVVPRHTETRIDKLKCDLCGAESHDRDDWSAERYAVAETTIQCKTGSSYPEGGSGTEYNIDLCPTCFEEKLIPWLQSQGATVKEKEWEY